VHASLGAGMELFHVGKFGIFGRTLQGGLEVCVDLKPTRGHMKHFFFGLAQPKKECFTPPWVLKSLFLTGNHKLTKLTTIVQAGNRGLGYVEFLVYVKGGGRGANHAVSSRPRRPPHRLAGCQAPVAPDRPFTRYHAGKVRVHV
jgi:hypothetical protein